MHLLQQTLLNQTKYEAEDLKKKKMELEQMFWYLKVATENDRKDDLTCSPNESRTLKFKKRKMVFILNLINQSEDKK